MTKRSIPDMCSIPGCAADVSARGWCEMHYSRYKRHGDPLLTWPNRTVVDYTEKPCRRCGAVKPLTDYYRDAGFADGYKAQCKKCAQERKDRPEVRARQREYNRTDSARASHERYYQRGNGKIARQNYAASPERKAYRKSPAYLEYMRRAAQERLARKKELPATLTDAQWQAALTYFHHACAYCGTTGATLAQEHVVPLSKGGGYTADNIVPSCKPCNSAKHNKSLAQWAPPAVCLRIETYLALIATKI